MARFVRLGLEIEALFGEDGRLIPKRLLFEGKAFVVERVLEVRRSCPREVGCIAPLMYRVIIEGYEKEIYYERDTNKWFSVKELHNI